MLEYHALSEYGRQRQQDLLNEAARERLADLARTHSRQGTPRSTAMRIRNLFRGFAAARNELPLDRLEGRLLSDRPSL